MNQQNFNQNELENLLNPPKSKAPVIIGLMLAFLGILFMGGLGFTIYKFANSEEFQTAFQEGFQEGLQEGNDYNESDNLISITKEQATEWVHTNETALQALLEKAKAYPQLQKVWLASADDLESHNIYVWINDVTCTASPGAENNDDKDKMALFTDVLNELNVPVTAFYDLTQDVQALNLVGFDLNLDSSEEVGGSERINGIDLYHAKYGGVFYYSFDPDQAGDDSEHLYGNWWYFP